MATDPRTEPSAAGPPAPSAEPLPEFAGVDVAGLAERAGHPVLRAVAGLLVRNWPSGQDAVAYYEDGA
ncbi:YxD-tail cyclophane-containing RiPP peptide [Streptomyces sp. YGL11-2]|uniref:YxD-tail cyclophane-containing RiPP peptide n=1 Tax=Streptomyces sp. YGL11-2 TaxID=3414028 RepID=UPI003CED1BCC